MMKDWSYRGWTHTAAMGMQNRIPTLGGIHRMDMAHQLDHMNTQDMGKEMKPEFKVGDKVVTKRGAFCEVISMTEDWVQTRSYRTGLTFLWSKRHDRKLRFANIYDEAGERWRCELRTKTKLSIHDMDTTPPWDRGLSEEGLAELYNTKLNKRIQQEMEPKFKVGDIVKTELHEIGQVAAFFEKQNNVRVHVLKGVREGKTLIFSAHFLTKTNLKDGTAAYTQEGCLSNITQPAERMEDIERAVYQHLKQQLRKATPQPIFRLVHKEGWYEGGGAHFVLVAEDEHEMLVREVDLVTARVMGDPVYAMHKVIWTRDYSIGDEIINFLSARGGNFTNKVVDNG